MNSFEQHTTTAALPKTARGIEMSQRLKEFLAAYLSWVDSGAPDGQPFIRRLGLCSNFQNWANSYETDEEIHAAFVADGLDVLYPFGGPDTYFDEQDAGKLHMNQERINWVRSKVAQHEVV
jgi:hypothetical protein